MYKWYHFSLMANISSAFTSLDIGFEAIEQLGFLYRCIYGSGNSHSRFSLDFLVNIGRDII